MARTPPEYMMLFRCTDQPNRGMSSGTVTIAANRFQMIGTGLIGKITRIEVRHMHSSTTGIYHDCSATINWSDGSAKSDTVHARFGMPAYVLNTIISGLPTPEQWSFWTGVTLNLGADSGLYWRATEEQPLDVRVYFYDKHDLVDGASPPVLGSALTHSDSAGHLATFGSYVQGYSRPVITCPCTLDARYPYLSAQHTLTLRLGSASGQTLFTRTQTDNMVFDVGAINASGTIYALYSVTDTAGNSVSRTYSFTVLPYAAPRVDNLSVARYISTKSDTGADIFREANDGEHVWFNFQAYVSSVLSKNKWSLSLAYGAGNDPTSAIGTVFASGADGSSSAVRTATDDRSILDTSIPAANAYWFKFTLSDLVTSTTAVCYVGKAIALFNVEENGVAVGMYSTGDHTAKKFEVAQDYESHLYGPTYLDGGVRYVNPDHHVSSLRALGFQFGSILPSGNVAGNTTKDFEIQFPEPYPVGMSPVVLVGFSSSSTAGTFGRCCCSATGVTNAGFTLRFFNGDSSNRDPGFFWIALNTGESALYQRPEGGMRSNSSRNCVATASSTWSESYAPWKAFDRSMTTSWASSASDIEPWLQLEMDVALRNIVVQVSARDASPVRNPVAGAILGSNDGTNFIRIGNFSNWDGSKRNGLLGEVHCENAMGFRYVRIRVDERTDSSEASNAYVAIGDVTIAGES